MFHTEKLIVGEGRGLYQDEQDRIPACICIRDMDIFSAP